MKLTKGFWVSTVRGAVPLALLLSFSVAGHADCLGTSRIVCRGYSEFGAVNSYDGGTTWVAPGAIVDGTLAVGYFGTVTNEGLVRGGALTVTRYAYAVNYGAIRDAVVGIRAFGSTRITEENGFPVYLPLKPGDIQSHAYRVGNNDLENYGSIDVNWDQFSDLGVIALGATGIRSAPDDTVVNFGSIAASGEFAAGIFGDDYAGVLNAAGATIDVNGANGYGIVLLGLNRGAAARNEGMIAGAGEYVRGMDLIGQGYLTNLGTIEVDGFSSLGMRGETGQQGGFLVDLTNGAGANIRVAGDDSEGMRAVVEQAPGAHATLTNDGSIEVAGDGAVGFWLEGMGQVTHNGALQVNGYNAGGIEASSAGWGDVQIETGAASSIDMAGDLTAGIYLVGQGSIQHGGNLVVNGASSWGVAGVTELDTDEINIISSGDITMQGVDSAGISLGGSGSAGNFGAIAINGIDSAGISVAGDEIAVLNAKGGSIDVHSSGSSGIYAELANGTIENEGIITTDAVGVSGVLAIGPASGIINTTNSGEIRIAAGVSVGMLALGGNHNLLNEGEIRTAGDQSLGVALGLAEIPVGVSLPAAASAPARGQVRNEGIIETQGTGSDGIHINVNGVNNSVSNAQQVRTFGDDAAGIAAVGDNITVTNEDTGVILTYGFEGDGIRVEGDRARIINAHQIQVSGTIDIGAINPDTGRTRGMVAEGNAAYLENQSGAEIQASGILSGAMRAVGEGAQLHNYGDVKIDSQGGARGMDVSGDNTRVENHVGATVAVVGTASSALNLFDVVDATVINAGEITGSGTNIYGVLVTGDLVTVTNTGSIELNGASLNVGIKTEGYQNEVNNSGTIRATGEGAGGIQLSAPTPSGLLRQRSVVNSGVIELAGAGSFGLSVGGREATVVNGPGATISAAQAGARGVTVTGDGHLILNQGTVATDGSEAQAVELNGANITLSNYSGAAITASGPNSAVVSSTGDAFTLENGGLIIGSGTNGTGITATESNTWINNTGTIAVDATGTSAIVLQNGNASELTNTGTISSANSAAPTIILNTTPQYDGAVLRNANGGVIANKAGGQAILGGAGVERLELTTGSEISGSIDLSGGDDTILVSGRVNGAVNLNTGNDTLVLLDGFELMGEVEGGQGDLNSSGARPLTTTSGYTLELLNDAIVADLAESSQVNGTNLTGFESLIKVGDGTLALDGNLTVDDVALVQGGLTLLSGASAQSDSITVVDGEFALNTNSRVSAEVMGIVGGQTSVFAGAELAVGELTLGRGQEIAELHLYDGAVSLTSQAGELNIYEMGVLAGNGVIDCSLVDNIGGIDEICGLRGGLMSPGDSPGQIDIFGDFAFDGGILEIELGGYDPGAFDVLKIAGMAYILDLQIEFSLLDDFMPDPTQWIDFLVADSLIGFDNIDFTISNMMDGFNIELAYTSSGLGVRASSVPEPGTLSLMVIGMLSLLLRRSRFQRLRSRDSQFRGTRCRRTIIIDWLGSGISDKRGRYRVRSCRGPTC